MTVHAESLDDLRFAAELRDQFERLVEGEPAGRTSRARVGGLRRRRWLLLAAGCLCCLIGVVLASVYLSAPQPHRHTFTRQPYSPGKPFAPLGGSMGGAPPVVGVELTGLSRGLDGTVWAWGDRQPRNAPRQALVEHWDGSAWRVLSLPRGYLDVVGLAAPSVNDVWLAVGGLRDERLLHWDGQGWQSYPGLGFGYTTEATNTLLALSARDVWAVGSRIGHWDGRSWTVVRMPGLGAAVQDLQLRLIRGATPDDLWALGDYRRFRKATSASVTERAPLGWEQCLLHWDGLRWSRMPWPTTQLATNPRDMITIEDVAVAADGSVWCTGNRWFGPDNTGDLWVPIVLRLQAGRWQVMASSARPGLPADWRQLLSKSISLVSSRDVWVVGVSGGGDLRAIAWHWDGQTWRVESFSHVGQQGAESVLAQGPDDVWLLSTLQQVSAGVLRRDPLLQHFDGTAWNAAPGATP